MNKQEIFDTVVKHLFDQKGPAINSSRCKYRHEGLKCAIGCLIPDDLYEQSMEGSSILPLLSARPTLNPLTVLNAYVAEDMSVRYALRYQFPDFFYLNSDLLEKLQRAHDESWVKLKSGENTWNYAALNKKLTFVAQKFELNRDVLDAEMSRVLTPLSTEQGVNP